MPPKSKKDDEGGLEVIYTHKNPEIDIVAVHGIGARRATTWTSKIEGQAGKPEFINWLSHKTMLPAKVPRMRVLSFGYASDWFDDNVMHTSLLTIGRMLLNSLLQKRRDCPNRPLIFITHCFGGLVTMTALTNQTDGTLSLMKATVGIFFLGTPFRGTHSDFYEKLPEIAKLELTNVHDFILQYLKEDNTEIQQLRRNFLQLRDECQNEPMKLICVAEEKPTKIQKLVKHKEEMMCLIVQHTSAFLDDGHKNIMNYRFQRDHFRLNKFEDPENIDFSFISEEIITIKNQALHTVDVPPLSRAPPIQAVAVGEQFKSSEWQEDALPKFQRPILREVSLEIKHSNPELKHRLLSPKFKPVAGSFSADCKYMFLRDNASIRIYITEEVKKAANDKTYRPPFFTICREGQGKIQFAFLGHTIGAYVTEKQCFVFTLNQDPPEQQEIRMQEEWRTSTMKCVSVTESILPNKIPLVLIAVGLQGDSNKDGDNTGCVALFRVWPDNWKEYTRIWQSKNIHTIENTSSRRAKKLTDSPKTLTFSRDGSVLVCTTKRYNQVHAWRLPSGDVVTNSSFGHIKDLCSVMIPFNDGPNAKGISAAVPWISSKDHPYVICTTVPSTERINSRGGEWTFMSPLSQPLLSAAKDYAYHCFFQIQGNNSNHTHIHGAAISTLGNIIAFLDSNGKLCLIPIESNTDNHGGFRGPDAEVPPIEIELKRKNALGRNDELRSDIKFNENGTKLYAITHSKAVEITLYDDGTDDAASQHELESSSSLHHQQSIPTTRQQNDRLPSIATSEFSVDFAKSRSWRPEPYEERVVRQTI